jgi:hypothetical protein
VHDSQSGHSGGNNKKKSHHSPFREMHTDRPARSLVSTLTELPRILFKKKGRKQNILTLLATSVMKNTFVTSE